MKKEKVFYFHVWRQNCQNICCKTSCGAAGTAGPFIVVSANMPPDRIGHRKHDEGTYPPTTPNRTELINLFSRARGSATDALYDRSNQITRRIQSTQNQFTALFVRNDRLFFSRYHRNRPDIIIYTPLFRIVGDSKGEERSNP